VGSKTSLSPATQPEHGPGTDAGAPAEEPSRGVVRLAALVAVALLGGWFYVVWRMCQGRFDEMLPWILGTAAYLLAGHLIHPEPDHDNMGWFGGLVNDPFQLADNVNRFLAGLALLLWPGRCVAGALVAFLRPRRTLPPAPAPEPRPPWPGTFAWPAPAAPLASSASSPWPAPVPAAPAPAWTAEEVVSPELAAELIADQFPALGQVRVAPLGVGWDNTAYLVNDRYVFRFPRREVAAPLLETEARALPAIAARLPLPVPVPELVGRPTAAFRWPFTGYRFLEGRTACRARLDPQQRLEAAAPLGRFLATLHALPVDDMVALGVGGDSIGRLDLTTRVPRALEMLNGLPPAAVGVDPEVVRRLIESSAAIRAPASHVLAHGDLYVRHLLVDGEARLCGVIDWGDLHIGNPAVDLAIAYGFLPPAARPAFLRAYGRRVPAPTWWLARFRAVFSSLCLIDYARQTGDADLEQEGRASLANAVAGA
jgi:aminoglycoside phosphotransferase (APT) family kinase protein